MDVKPLLDELYRWISICNYADSYYMERLRKRDMDISIIFDRYYDLTNSVFCGDIPDIFVYSFRELYPNEYDLWIKTRVRITKTLNRIYEELKPQH